MNEILAFLSENWYVIVMVLVLLFAIYYVITNKKKTLEWLKYAVIFTEELLGEKTGQLKLRYCYDMFIQRFPVFSKIISFENFSKMVDEALVFLKDQLQNNEAIKNFVVETVDNAGSNPCPPIIIGVGIGGNFESCAELAKKALGRPVNSSNPDEFYANLENELLSLVNRTGIGPQGFGGSTTALGVNIETAPTHIAGMPCAVNISCHASRHLTEFI